MRKIGEQWIEEIDGKKHMLKAVPLLSIYDGKSINGRTCHGCSFVDEWDDDCTLKNPPCRISEHKAGPFIIKDLGILDDDGFLPCPFCREPSSGIASVRTIAFAKILVNFICKKCEAQITFCADTVEHCLDAWNRRA